jgi:hypothetical protein
MSEGDKVLGEEVEEVSLTYDLPKTMLWHQ